MNGQDLLVFIVEQNLVEISAAKLDISDLYLAIQMTRHRGIVWE